ncbi:MAG: SMP-30/gluconolactonase/LRE family protein [Ancalomicrobiaceae bacterium]|nr:SMP-30/gluconolactonase/LRE family protein [Ancalomicrobiaceae bacterium]
MAEQDISLDLSAPAPTLRSVPASACREHVASLQGGESPFWDLESRSVWLVDMYAPALLRVTPQSGAIRTWPMPCVIGSFALCDDGGVLVALRDGVYRMNLEREALTLVARPDPDRIDNRLNDGKASPEGRFWVGSMNESTPRRPEAALYRVDLDGRCTRVLDGLYTSNGLAWSPDGRKMYHSDSRGRILRVFDYDPASGDISSGRLIADLSEREGRPDGGTVDAEGCYWSAGTSAGVLNRFDPDGRLVERYHLPVAAPSMVCFGGADLLTLFVTSLAVCVAGRNEPGRLISFQAPVPGLPGHRFRAGRL